VKNLMDDKRAIRPGTVYLVGAGPGDPELVTLKARRLLEKADVILYDFLAPHEMLNWARPETEFIYVGKQGGSHTLPQEKINRLMVEAAREGKNVVRLKGGDPFIFGRGGEEAEVLADAGVPFELVPGISSAVSAPLYAGIPLTHRSCTSSVVFLTGHEAADKECTRVPWENVAKAGHTIVILMGVKNIRPNMQCLLDAGMDPNTPVGIIRWGTRPDQRTMTGTVATIADKVERGGFKAPAIIVVGEVVKYRDKLKWHDIKPLFGARVLVTRTKGQAEELSQLLLDAGADVYEVPAIEIVPAIDRPEVDAALDKLGEADWVVLTSANGVRLLMEALLRRGGDIRDLAGKKLAAIGPATAAKIEEMGIRVDLVPPEYKAEGLAASLGEEGVKGKKFLLARARAARETLPDMLREMGGEVTIAPIYDTRIPEGSGRKIKELVRGGKIDIAVFTSSSTVGNFVKMAGGEDLSGIKIASIGPVTSKTARELGLDVHVEADEYTVPALARKIIETFGGQFR